MFTWIIQARAVYWYPRQFWMSAIHYQKWMNVYTMVNKSNMALMMCVCERCLNEFPESVETNDMEYSNEEKMFS